MHKIVCKACKQSWWVDFEADSYSTDKRLPRCCCGGNLEYSKYETNTDNQFRYPETLRDKQREEKSTAPVLGKDTTVIANTPEFYNQILVDIQYPTYHFSVKLDGRGDMFLQGWYQEEDISTGKTSKQYTRRWFVSSFMTKSEFTQTVLKCVLTSMEHRVREHFKYKGMRVYSPHFDVEALWDLCKDKRYDYRKTGLPG